MVPKCQHPTNNSLNRTTNFNFFCQNVRVIWKIKPVNLLSRVRRVTAANNHSTGHNILPSPPKYFKYWTYNQYVVGELTLTKTLRFSKLWARQLKNVDLLTTIRFISYMSRTATYTQQFNCLAPLPYYRQNANNTLYSNLVSLI
jgi:hypothetical protein